MLILTPTTWVHGTSIYKKSFFRCCSNNKFISCIARQVFVEISKRCELQLFHSLSKGSIACEFMGKSHDQEWENISVREHDKHGNAHFGQMNGFGTKPTKYTLCSSLNFCAKTQNWHFGVQIHAQIIQIGYDENLFLNSALVDLYAKCDAMADARRAFDGMKRHDQVSWTSIISGFSQKGHEKEAILLFKEMLGTQIKPNSFTYVGVISACTGLEEPLELGKLLHARVISLGFESNSFVLSSLIDCYSKCGRIDQAKSLFDVAIERDNILLNSMISGYSQNLYGEEALKLFVEMRNDNLSPTNHTLSSILNACGNLTVLQQGRQVHSLVIKMGSESNVFVVSTLTDMYSKCGSIGEAHQVFDQMVEKNSVLSTSMIMGYAQNGRALDALKLFECLVMEGWLIPDLICFTAVLSACNHAGLLDRGVEYFNKMRRDYGLVPELDQYACLIDLYSRNGQLRKAMELMEEMPYVPNSVVWSSFLSSCNVYGEVELGREAANHLFKMEPCSAVPYITLANIYAKAGLWGEVAEIRNLMKQKGIRKSAGWSWVEVDKNVHIFSMGDVSHPQSQEIFLELEKLILEMKEVGYMPKQIYEPEDIDGQQL